MQKIVSFLSSKSLAILGIVAFFIITTLLFTTDIDASVSDEVGQVSVSFESPISVGAVVKTLRSGKFNHAIAQGSFTTQGREIQDFVVILPTKEISELGARWSDGRKVLIAQLTNDNFFEEASGRIYPDTSDVFEISKITVYGNKQSVLSIASALPSNYSDFFSYSDYREDKYNEEFQSIEPIEEGQMMLLADSNTPYYLSVPSSGQVMTGTFTAPGVTTPTRGVLNYMNWNSILFEEIQTYEHDFFLSSSGGTYLDRNFSIPPWCQPNAVYAATSWTSASEPYLDSNLDTSGLCQSSGWITFAIGSGRADELTTGNHFTALLMANGDSATDNYLLQGQVGYRNPSNCHSTLCSYAYGYAVNETTHYGVSNGSVPAMVNWTRPAFTPDTPVNVSVSNPTASSLRLNFRDITWDETNISVERRIGTSGAWTTFNFGILNNGTTVGNWYWNNTGLSSGTQYCYRMRASNANGHSSYSPTVCGTTL